MKTVTTFFSRKNASFLIITSGVAGTWFVPTVNNEGADQPKDTGAVLSAPFFFVFSLFFSWGGLVPIVNNEGANQPKSTCAV